MFYLCYLYLFTRTAVHHDFHIRWCSCRLAATRRESLVGQELLTIPINPVYGRICFGSVFNVLSSVLFIIVCPFSFCHCIVCPSSYATDYPFGIFKYLLNYIYILLNLHVLRFGNFIFEPVTDRVKGQFVFGF